MYSGDHAEPNSGGIRRFVRSALSFAVTVLIAVGIIVALRVFLFQPYGIPSGSMETTIMTNDMVLSEKVTYRTRAPLSGDVVTFADPEIPGRTLVKRVVATGGQTVDLQDGRVVVDGAPLDEPYTNDLPSNPLRSDPGANVSYPYTVPEGYLWVMGDNRTNSQDSRYFGAIPVSSVTGRVFFTYWPLNHLGPLE